MKFNELNSAPPSSRKLSKQFKGLTKKTQEPVMKTVFFISACVTILCVLLIFFFLIQKGFPPMSKYKQGGILGFLFGQFPGRKAGELTSWWPSMGYYSILPFIVSSLYVTLGAIVVGVPIGLLSAIFMAYFCPKRIHKIISPLISLMAGIPSVIYGFIGAFVLVPFVYNTFGGPEGKLKSGSTLLTASIVLGIMLLPTIISVAESSIRAVPESYYEGALALGASKVRSVFFVVVPAAKSGIFAAIVLGIGRAIGETMAVKMVVGGLTKMPHSYLDGGQPMTAEIATELGYAGPEKEAYLFGIALVLLVFILIINFVLAAIKGGSKEGKSKSFIAKAVDSSKLARSMQANAAKRALASLERGKQKAQQRLAKQHSENKTKASTASKLTKGPDLTSVVLRFFVLTAIGITVAFIASIVIYILYNGIPNLKPQFFELEYNSINLSLVPSLLTTVAMVLLGLLIAGPLGIFAAVFLTEYSRKDNLFIKAIRLAAETLAGIPSIIYGVFGYITFVHLFKGTSLMAGVLTVSIMILPLIMRTAEEAILAVPDTYREGSFGLGAGKLRTVFKIVLPSAAPGILSGVILAIGRVFGETAALMLTSGASHGFGGATLAVHLYSLTFNGNDHLDALFATAVILLIVAVGINALSSWTAKKVGKGQISTEKTKRKAKAV